VVGVASLHAGEGATTALLCLAARLAARGRRTIAVDGNFAAPSLAQRLGAQPPGWWQDVLDRGSPVGDAVVRASGDGLDLLALDARPADASRLASGLQASVTAGVLRYAYELVLVDLGAILAPRSQPAALNLVGNMRIESALVVTRPDADLHIIETAARLLEEHGCELLGTIENRVTC
jgi:Mrp family chromosome partitioning ATPase